MRIRTLHHPVSEFAVVRELSSLDCLESLLLYPRFTVINNELNCVK